MTETTTSRPAPSGEPPGSAAPQPPSGWGRLPMIPGPWETVVLVWRRLRRMSTALLMLFALALSSIVATFVPQEPVVPQTVAAWRAGTEGPGTAVSQVLDAAQLYDVFGSWWFATLTVLLFVSLTGCLIPRYHAFWRVSRRPPAVGRNLGRLGNRVTLHTAVTPDAALAAVDGALARHRFRRRRVAAADTASGLPQVAAEKGHLREGGNLVFHSAFYVLLVGVMIGQAFGFTGQINVAEGTTFSDTRIVYGAVRAGRFFGVDDHRGFQVRLDDFDATYHANGTPDAFVSRVSIVDQGRTVREQAPVEVNHPLTYDGMKLYQLRFGMAPHVVVRAGDTVLYDDRVMLADAGGGVWTGTAKLKTSGDDQIALDVALLPDFAVDPEGRPVSRSPRADNPVLFADLWVGQLGLDRAAAASDFLRDGEPVASTSLAPGDTSEPLVGNLTVAFPEMAMWSGFQVSHAPGRGVLLVSSALLLAGLLASLYAYRRRVWAEASTDDSGATTVVLAGVALQRKVEFEAAFERLADDVRAALPPADDREPTTTTTEPRNG